MENTINDLYLKYVNNVGETLEDDRYFQYLFEMVQAGSNTLHQTNKILHKVVDERWLTTIEETLDSLNEIIEKPRRFITTNEEVVPVALAKKITADSVRHLSMNTQFIASDEDGDIQPTRVLNVSTEESYDLYENRFIYHLIQKLVTFIDKRTDVIFWSTGDEIRNTLQMESKVDDAYEEIEYKIEMKIKNKQSFAENDSDNLQVFMRIDRVRRLVMALRNSAFCSLMAGCSMVRSPIQRTNLMMKDPHYRACYKLWQFLESYDEVGYTIEERDSALQFDEEYLIQMYTNLITNYTVFKSLLEGDSRNLEEIEVQQREVVKPKFIKQIEEQIVDDYNIPDVEVRQVIIEEVTQAQLDAEAKLEEETALRKAAEEARESAELQLENERWRMQMETFELQQAAEEELAKVKQESEAEIAKTKQDAEAVVAKTKQESEAEIAKTKQDAEEEIAKTKQEADAQVQEAQQIAESKMQAAAEEVAKTKQESEAEIARTKQDAEEEIAKTKQDAEAEIAKTKQDAEAEIAKTKQDADAQVQEARQIAESKMQAAAEEVAKTKQESEAEIARTKQDAKEQVEAAESNAQNEIEEIRRNAEMQIAEIKRQAEQAVKEAQQALKEAEVRAQQTVQEAEARAQQTVQETEARAQQAIKEAETREKAVRKLAEREAKARLKAEAKADANRFSNRIAGAVEKWLSVKNAQEEENSENDEE